MIDLSWSFKFAVPVRSAFKLNIITCKQSNNKELFQKEKKGFISLMNRVLGSNLGRPGF